MKRFVSIATIIASFIFLMSCGNGNQKWNISNTQINTNVLGLNLCEESDENAIKKAISKEIDKEVLWDFYKLGVGTTVRVVPMSSDINYEGLSWNYVDVTLNEENQIVQITIVASYNNIEKAKEQFAAATKVFNQKYGKGNTYEENHYGIWTDGSNYVDLTLETEDAAIGNDRIFCSISYVNIELGNAFDEASASEI